MSNPAFTAVQAACMLAIAATSQGPFALAFAFLAGSLGTFAFVDHCRAAEAEARRAR